ncbi:MAG TPA: 3-hydroxyacyl-CoA dehydrogenase family protein [Blastocatellia bacterium]|nr:3-hydroxyacyl-CoA dehydrogenase family protein [Blastocatellia bacterium]
MSIEKIAVIGAGTMGHGIAQVAAQAGYAVALADVSEDMTARGLGKIEENLKKGVERGKVTDAEMREALSRIRATTNIQDASSDAGLIVEAIIENLEAKRALFNELGRFCPAGAILATNTSSLSIESIAQATARRDRVIGMHFFNPVHIMKLIEVVIGPETSDVTLRAVLDVAERMGKEAITVKDAPGFATSRLGVALGLEAMRMLEAEVASAEDIDKAMVLGYNHPMGPLRLTDLVGLDIRLSIADYLFEKLGSEVFRPPDILRRKVSEGKLGKKTGEGFYKWD